MRCGFFAFILVDLAIGCVDVQAIRPGNVSGPAQERFALPGMPQPLTAEVTERFPTSDSAAIGTSGRLSSNPRSETNGGEVIVGHLENAFPHLDRGILGQAKALETLRMAREYTLLRLPPDTDRLTAIRYLESIPGVESVSPNYRIVRRSAPTNDPFLPSQWAYEASVADVYGAWSILDQQAAARLSDTVVAVIDSGVDALHPDLDVVGAFAASRSLVVGQPVNTFDFDQGDSDHGIGVAGIIGAKKGNGIGAAGVVPGAPLLSLNVDSEEGGTFAILRALVIAGYYNRSDSPYPNLKGLATGKVRVVNLSVGPSVVGRIEPFDSALEFLRQRGIVVVVAAGNDAVDGRVEVPANSPAAVGVSASMQYLGFELLAPYSSHGPEIWVAGPGNFIWTTAKRGTDSTYANAYRLFNGTSSAAPFVAGVAAAVNVVYGPGSPIQETAAWADRVKQRLADTADDLGSPGRDSLYGYGRVNARKAITGAL